MGTQDASLAAPPAIPTPPPYGNGLSFLGLLQSRGTLSNVVSTNPFLDGQVVGAMGGTNGTTVHVPGETDLDNDGEPEDTTVPTRVVEQRATAFFTYAPSLLDGRLSTTAGFEIDMAWGDSAYGTGGNTGGGYGADQVNLQTRRLHVTARALEGSHALTLVGGLQFLADGVYDPAHAWPDDLFRTGGGLRFFGSEAAGLAAYGRIDDASGTRWRYRAGSFGLVEGGTSVADDVSLHLLDLQFQPDWRSFLGLHAWYLRDTSGGTGGIAGLGPTSALSELQGGPRLALGGETDADLFWLTVDGGWNHDLKKGPLGLRGSLTHNAGKLYVTGESDAAVRGWAADGELRLRYAPGEGSVLRLGSAFTSADDADTRDYEGIVTGNSYGVVGAIWATHGTRLLFADAGAVNRQVAVAPDISNGGQGLLAITGGLGWDAIPDRLNLALDAAHATDAAGTLGTELDLGLSWEPLPLVELGAAGGIVLTDRQPANPWTALLTFDWLVL